MKETASDPLLRSRTYRAVTTAVGILFIVLAILILVVADEITLGGSLLAATFLGLLGIDALVSAGRGKRSILSRIGPLP